ncbi:MAG: phosphoribosylanthranilate isomerase [Candidatus Eisenbacteria bacterium]|uniref:N-(5'-phosphoribosyl)anthranilate isomerase n=1 Tax=Eiseniibacteriota bacterium TaxID=2212470 RepID=A0A956NAA4_UNCEI|nr:phosphoribosylanthranilate isomerase [Candidatus Eisenbacteria bacterium]
MTSSSTDRATVRVKICGLTRPGDAALAAGLGASFLGFVFAPSPRQADPDDVAMWLPDVRAAFPGVRSVGVFVNPTDEQLRSALARVDLDLVQIHRRASAPDIDVPWIRAVHPNELPSGQSRSPWAWLVDTPSANQAGGTGKTFDWSVLPTPPRPYRLFLAGGLAPENVAEAVRLARPYAVDASSRLESQPGCKDPTKLAEFFEAVRSTETRAGAGAGESEASGARDES